MKTATSVKEYYELIKGLEYKNHSVCYEIKPSALLYTIYSDLAEQDLLFDDMVELPVGNTCLIPHTCTNIRHTVEYNKITNRLISDCDGIVYSRQDKIQYTNVVNLMAATKLALLDTLDD